MIGLPDPMPPWTSSVELGELCALLAAVTWSVSVVLFKRSSEQVSPQSMNMFKNAVATVLLLLTMPLLGLGFDPARPVEDWVRLVASGILGISVADTLVLTALRELGAVRLAVVECAYAPVIVVLSVAFLDERIGALFVLGGTLVLAGVLLSTLSRRVEVGEEETRRVVRGVLSGLLGIGLMAVGIVLAKPVLERSHLVEVTAVRLGVGLLGLLLWVAVRPSARGALAVFRPSPAWRTLVPAAVLGSYIAMLFWLGGFKWADASVASVLNQLSAVFTIVLARVVLGESVTSRRMVGAGLAVVGAILVVVPDPASSSSPPTSTVPAASSAQGPARLVRAAQR